MAHLFALCRLFAVQTLVQISHFVAQFWLQMENIGEKVMGVVGGGRRGGGVGGGGGATKKPHET